MGILLRSFAKMRESIEMPFWTVSWVGREMHVLYGSKSGKRKGRFGGFHSIGLNGVLGCIFET